jgi:hypothetical protein
VGTNSKIIFGVPSGKDGNSDKACEFVSSVQRISANKIGKSLFSVTEIKVILLGLVVDYKVHKTNYFPTSLNGIRCLTEAGKTGVDFGYHYFTTVKSAQKSIDFASTSKGQK